MQPTALRLSRRLADVLRRERAYQRALAKLLLAEGLADWLPDDHVQRLSKLVLRLSREYRILDALDMHVERMLQLVDPALHAVLVPPRVNDGGQQRGPDRPERDHSAPSADRL